MKLSRLVLTGFMGAGKTTVGALLARSLGWRFLDLDDQIEALAQQTVAEIFRDQGEARFRELEHQALTTLASEENLVLALGGGAVESEANRTLLLQTPGTCLVFLDAPLLELLQRCHQEGTARPLLADLPRVQARHNARLPHYRAAHMTIDTNGLAPPEVAANVHQNITKHWQVEDKKGK